MSKPNTKHPDIQKGTSGFREELEKAYYASDAHYFSVTEIEKVLWAAKWMAERCAGKHTDIDHTSEDGKKANAMGALIRYRDSIRQLAKELE
jgi:hypothetical protein